MDLNEFQRQAELAMASLPPQFRDAIENVVICVEDEADPATLIEMDAQTSNELLGLYQGWPLPERGVSYSGHLPDTIYLYRKPILSFCDETGERLEDCVRHVLIHEIGHYFGFSDEDMLAIEAQVEKESTC